jgi:ubiquitin-like domain-containing CTD phosphatase 1
MKQWIQHKAKEDNLQKFTESTEVHIINPPRTTANSAHKPLLVLDLDHTLLDFSSRTLTENGATARDIGSSDDTVANRLKRPYMDEFLTWTYKYYDLVVWSQTSWRWLEVRSSRVCIILIVTLIFSNNET